MEGCDAAYIVWRPVLGAVLYRLQFLENSKIFNNATTRTASFIFSLSDPLFKGKTFSVEVSEPANIYDTNGDAKSNICRLVQPFAQAIQLIVTMILLKWTLKVTNIPWFNALCCMHLSTYTKYFLYVNFICNLLGIIMLWVRDYSRFTGLNAVYAACIM